jgi:hypothetical protein
MTLGQIVGDVLLILLTAAVASGLVAVLAALVQSGEIRRQARSALHWAGMAEPPPPQIVDRDPALAAADLEWMLDDPIAELVERARRDEEARWHGATHRLQIDDVPPVTRTAEGADKPVASGAWLPPYTAEQVDELFEASESICDPVLRRVFQDHVEGHAVPLGCCEECGGTGAAADGPCWDCRGTGHTHEGSCT